jgi:hypothetical protein
MALRCQAHFHRKSIMARHRKQREEQHFFTATDVAEYEYCSLAWWHDHFEPLALADSEDLLGRLVELEQIFGVQAPVQPEYQVIEQLLNRRGTFEHGRDQHASYAEEVAGRATHALRLPEKRAQHMRRLLVTALLLLLLAVLLVVAALVFR